MRIPPTRTWVFRWPVARPLRTAFLLVIAAACIVGCKRKPRADPAATQPSTPPTTASATTTPATPPAVSSYVALYRLTHPRFPATEPIGIPVDVPMASHLIFTMPVYLCPRQDLWFTSPDARPDADALANAADAQTHVVREQVLFVHWRMKDDQTVPLLFCAGAPGAPDQLVSSESTRPLPNKRPFRWGGAFSWNDRVVVPTDSGVSIFDFSADPVREFYHKLPLDGSAAATAGPPQITLDTRGLLAWRPWDNRQHGSHGAMRFVDDHWTSVSLAPDSSQHPIHLIPLLDGTLLQLLAQDNGQAALALTPLEGAAVDNARVAALVDALSDPDEAKRDAAFADLLRFGPGAWATLEKLLPDQPPEAQARLRDVLANRLEPTLGGLRLADGHLRTLSRQPDGAAFFYADAGVRVRNGEKDNLIQPAWISIRPGGYVKLLSPSLVRDLNPDHASIQVIGNEWIVNDGVRGPRRFIGNATLALVRKDERTFSDFVGIDRRGRWLFRRAATPSTPAATLIIDPTLPDNHPRLPVWLMQIDHGSAGWNAQRWPTIKRGGTWVLEAAGWRAANEKTEPLFTERPPRAMVPATGPSTSPTTMPAGPPVFIDTDGTRYFGGNTSLIIVKANGLTTTWPLPPEATGQAAEPHLFAAGGALFLLNQPGRVLRLKPTPSAAEPFVVEAVFTHNIPDDEHPHRIWQDPAGRIDIAYGDSQLAILFPTGDVPPELARMMPSSSDDDEAN